MAYEHGKLLPKHHEVMRLVAMGMGDRAVAKKLGITSATVANLRGSVRGRNCLAVKQGKRDVATFDVIEEARAQFEVCLGTLKEAQAQTEDGSFKYRASDAINAAIHTLGLGGVAPVKRVEVKKQTALGVFTADDLKEFKAAHVEALNSFPTEEEIIDV